MKTELEELITGNVCDNGESSLAAAKASVTSRVECCLFHSMDYGCLKIKRKRIPSSTIPETFLSRAVTL
jgi:hypothetical protein